MATEQARGSATRARLLDAAVTAFGNKGFHGTTTRDIAAAAGMSPAAVYVHHRTKEEILFQISAEGHRQILQVIHDSAAEDSGPTDRLAATVRAFVAFHAENHVKARVVNYELAALTVEHRNEVIKLRRSITQVFHEIVRAGLQTGDFSVSDLEISATAIMSLGVDITRWYSPDGPWTPEMLGEIYAESAMRIVGVAAPSSALQAHRTGAAGQTANAAR